VFLVASIAHPRRTPILLEREGSVRDSQEGEPSRSDSAGTVGGGAANGPVNALTANGLGGGGAGRQPRPSRSPDIAATLNSGGNDGGFRTEPGEHLVIA
jgi:hypothetical protein